MNQKREGKEKFKGGFSSIYVAARARERGSLQTARPGSEKTCDVTG